MLQKKGPWRGSYSREVTWVTCHKDLADGRSIQNLSESKIIAVPVGEQLEKNMTPSKYIQTWWIRYHWGEKSSRLIQVIQVGSRDPMARRLHLVGSPWVKRKSPWWRPLLSPRSRPMRKTWAPGVRPWNTMGHQDSLLVLLVKKQLHSYMSLCVCNVWIDVKLLVLSVPFVYLYYIILYYNLLQGVTGVPGGRWPTKTPPRDPWKRTCGTVVAHLGAYKSQLVATIVPSIYI